MEYKSRKHPRLKDYDYSQPGAYFITICTKDRRNILGRVPAGHDYMAIGEEDLGQRQVVLSAIGETCRKFIENINVVYDFVKVSQYVIMPNHIHLLLTIESAAGGMRASRPTVSTVVRSFKTMVTKQVGTDLWQTSFYEHVIRNERDYTEIWRYIQENPMKWEFDQLFTD